MREERQVKGKVNTPYEVEVIRLGVDKDGREGEKSEFHVSPFTRIKID